MTVTEKKRVVKEFVQFVEDQRTFEFEGDLSKLLRVEQEFYKELDLDAEEE